MCCDQNMPDTATAELRNKVRITNPHGWRWSDHNVRSVLTKEKYAGTLAHHVAVHSGMTNVVQRNNFWPIPRPSIPVVVCRSSPDRQIGPVGGPRIRVNDFADFVSHELKQ